jgi:hypothetical protein
MCRNFKERSKSIKTNQTVDKGTGYKKFVCKKKLSFFRHISYLFVYVQYIEIRTNTAC